jgi:methionine-rich copper-binding protein CopC
MFGKLMGALAIALGATILVPTLAFGHADYESSTPGDGETVTTVPTRVDVYFTQEVDPDGANSLNVTNASGADVDNNDATVDSADATHMSITLQSGLANGTYSVEWATVSGEDGEEDSDTFEFTVNAAAPTSTGGASTPAPGAPTTGFGPGGSGGGSPLFAVVGLAFVGAIAVTAGGYALRLTRS